MKRILSFIGLCLYGLTSFGQNDFTLSVLANTTFVNISSEYELENTYKPRLGFSVGAGYPVKFKKIEMLAEISLLHTSIKDDHFIWVIDESGSTNGFYDKRIESNYFIGLSSILRVEKGNFKFGAGLNFQVLLTSHSYFKNFESYQSQYSLNLDEKNKYLKSVQLFIPLEVSITTGRFEILARYEHGVLTRLKQNQGIGEFYNILNIGRRYHINK